MKENDSLQRAGAILACAFNELQPGFSRLQPRKYHAARAHQKSFAFHLRARLLFPNGKP
jgi:hypothetical protein